MKKDLVLIIMSSLFLSISFAWIIIETITHYYKNYNFDQKCIFSFGIALIFYIYIVKRTIKNANKKVDEFFDNNYY
jgi:hypothetical protein